MATQQPLFAADFGHIFDFKDKRPSDIFNEAILPTVNSFVDLLGDDPGGLGEATERRKTELKRRTAQDVYAQQEDDEFLNNLIRPETPQPAIEMGDYDSPTSAPASSTQRSTPPIRNAPKDLAGAGFTKTSVKLANYGYDADLSPDYNSNVLRIGHSNNKLVDGYSAALTKSLATRYGLKTGDEFEVVTADGKVMTRRYDDTVPTKYKGRALPETVDLYEPTKGSNSFGGKVVGIRPLKKSGNGDPKKLNLPIDNGDISQYDNPILPPRA